MLPHWRYVLDDLFAPVRTVFTLGATHIHERADEAGEAYRATAEDAAYATFELDGGIVAQLNSSWCVRVNRDELVEFQVDGTDGSAVAGLRGCRVQPRGATPRALWNPDIPNPLDFRAGWLELPDQTDYDNGFKIQWELFLRHVVADEPFPWDLARGRQGGPAGRAGRSLVARAPDARGAGARAVSIAATGELLLPRADGSLERFVPGPPGDFERPREPLRSRIVLSPPPTWWPIRWPPASPCAPALDWDATLAYRRHLWSWGLGVAEAMDTAQRGMGLGWAEARELIRRSAAEARACGGAISAGAGTDQLPAGPAHARSHPRGLSRAVRLRRGAGRAADPDGQPRAGRRGAAARTTTGRCSTPCSSSRRARDPALAGRDVRPHAGRLLGRRRSGGGRAGSCSS